jgi:hypothetical protein
MLGMHSLMGADLRKISSFYWDDETDNEGVDRYFPKGYKQIIDLIAEGTDIVLNAVVVKVEETSDRILVRFLKAFGWCLT